MKALNIILLICAAIQVRAQIILKAEDFPTPVDTFLLDGWLNPAKPSLTPDNTWNYTGLGSPANNYQVILFEEDLEFFKNEGIDFYRNSTKDFNANFFYYLDLEFDLNDNALSERGIYVPQQRYSLSPYTNNPLDSLIMPTQAYLYSSSIDHLRFPLTYEKSWNNISRRAVNFQLTVNAFGLNKVPAQHVWYAVRKDTILSFGSMQIMTPNGISRKYEVLVDQIESYTIDSFYLAGAPAPSLLLNNFGLVQGQKTNQGNRINFYRKDLFHYFASFYYGDRSFNAQPYEFFTCINGAQTNTSSVEDDASQFRFTVFPTILTNNHHLNLLVTGNAYKKYNFTITDSAGRILKKGMLENGIILQLNSIELTYPGMYIINIQDDHGKYIAHEKIQKF